MTLSRNLTEQEMEFIQSEELFRAAIRQEIESKPTTGSALGLWGFLNSSFGLWLLSTVFISWIGTIYTNYQNSEKVNQQIAEAQRLQKDRGNRLSMEFSYRLSNALIKLEEADRIMDDKHEQADPYKLRLDAFAELSRPSMEGRPPLFSEFKTYSGIALVAELSTITSPSERKVLKDRITALSGLLNDASIIDLNKPQAFKILAGELIERIQYPRWENGFRFTDCHKENPFC